jgi:O-antigen ligase
MPRLAALVLGLLFCSLQFDWGLPFGSFTVYHNEVLLAGLLPWAVWQARQSPLGRAELRAWCLAFLPLALWLLLHVAGPDSPWGALKGALRAAEFACGLALPCLMLQDKQDLGFALKVGALAATFTCLWALAQVLGGPGSPLNTGRELEFIHGFQAGAAGFGHHNQMGAFFVSALCLGVAAWSSGVDRAWSGLGILAALLGLLASFSRGAWAGAILALLCCLPLLPAKGRWVLLGLMAGAALLALFGPSDALRQRAGSMAADPDRAEHFRAAWSLWQGHAWWGWGAEGLQAQAKVVAAGLEGVSAEGRASFASHLHNTYLQVGLSWGWPALLGWLLFLCLPLKRIWKGLAQPQTRTWALALLASMLGFMLQASTDVLIIHARGLAVSLCWGLMICGLRLAWAEVPLAPKA